MSAPSGDGGRVPTGGTSSAPAHDQGGPPSQGRSSDAGSGGGGRGTTSDPPITTASEKGSANKTSGGTKDAQATHTTASASPQEEKAPAPPQPSSASEESKDGGGDQGGAALGTPNPPRMVIVGQSGMELLRPGWSSQRGPEFPTRGSRQAAATRWALPSRIGAPPRYYDPHTTFTGVPAKLADTVDDPQMLNGFGGLEVLVGVEGLTDEHVREIRRRVAPKAKINREVLLAQDGDPGYSISELRELVDSIGGKRELASLVRLYGLDDLARRVFGTATLLRRTMDRAMAAERQLQSSGMPTQLQLLDLQEKIQEAKSERAGVAEYYEKLFDYILEQCRQEKADHQRDFKRAAQEHERQEEALRAQNDDLQREVDDLRDHVRALENRLSAGSLNVGKVMNFLNRHNTQVTGNWPRLQGLLERAKDFQAPPPEWITQIMVTAADDFLATPGPYVIQDEGSADSGNQDGSGGNPGSHSGSKDKPLDVTGDSSSPSRTPPPRQFQGSASHSMITPVCRTSPRLLWGPQLRPDTYTPDNTDARDPREAVVRTEAEARASLKDVPVEWNKLRTDLQLLMMAGHDYEDALKMITEDKPLHSLFHAKPLVQMLVRMMFWQELDSTPWSKYVPSWYFKKAEVQLESLSGDPEGWPSLNQRNLNDAREVEAALYGNVGGATPDDETKDGSYQPESPVNNSGRRVTPPRQSKRRESLSSSSDVPTPVRSTKRVRPAQVARQSTLAQKEYSQLTIVELRIIEVPDKGIFSWRHLGILAHYLPASQKAKFQTAYFPNYAPNVSKDSEAAPLAARWDTEAVKALLESKPWDDMYKERSRFLLLHNGNLLDEDDRTGLYELVKFMREHRCAIWHTGHWFCTPKTKDDWTAKFVIDRKTMCDLARKQYKALQDRLVNAGLQESILEEPGIWKIPAKSCPWIFMDATHVKENNAPHTLKEQLAIVDAREPARAQWTTCTSDEDRVKRLPDILRAEFAKCRRLEPYEISPLHE